ncbi:uncharacterized protein LOC108740072 [Agrilus planipennis]|uniref:Uncharacterized protein LOC108740072 n=1 Tax=Agrilus planipennis TaxID=224129 RepID=A0A1W4XBQ0_AGRPL|nr:uncharacterized protein LOC108740072 [Agrilus planipennis]
MTNLTLWLALLIIPTITTKEIDITSLSSDTGFYVKFIDDLRIIEQQYSLIIVKDIKPLTEGIEQVEKLINKVRTIENSLKNQAHSYVHTVILDKQLKYLKRNVDIINNSLLSKRNKRGLINGVGTIFHYLFGTMDADEDQDIQKSVNELQLSNKNILTLVDRNVHIVKDTIKSFNDTLSSLSLTEQTISKNFDKINKAINTNSLLIHGNEFSIRLLNMITFSDEILTEYTNEINNIKQQILYAKLNKIPPSFLENNLLKQSILEINRQVPEFELPFNPDTELYKFLDSAKLNIQMINSTIIYKIKIPLLSKDIFKLYHILSIPVRKNNHFQIFIPETPYVAIERLKSIYTSFTSQMELMNIQDKIFIINPNIRDKDDGNCETDILFQGRLTNKCHGTLVNIDQSEIRQLEENQWLVTVPAPTDFTYKCKDMEIRTVILNTNCIIQLNDQCTGMLGNHLKITYYKRKPIYKNITGTMVQIPNDCCLPEKLKKRRITSSCHSCPCT